VSLEAVSATGRGDVRRFPISSSFNTHTLYKGGLMSITTWKDLVLVFLDRQIRDVS